MGTALILQLCMFISLHVAVSASEGCAESLKESLGFFCDSSQAWHFRKEIASQQYQRNLESMREHYNPPGMTGRFIFQHTWEPEIHCTFMERIGHMGDGGKWVCDPYHLRFHKQCLVYSIGSNNQFDFENGLLAQYPHCEVHTFDHTSSPPGPRDNQAVNFHSLRLSTFDDMDSHNITLPTAIKLLSHTGRWINILKIDIEGDEYKVLRPLLKQGSLLQNVVQILIELHTPPLTAPQFHELMTGFHSLGFAIFSKEPNTEGCGGDCIEYSLLRLTPAVFAQNATQEH